MLRIYAQSSIYFRDGRNPLQCCLIVPLCALLRHFLVNSIFLHSNILQSAIDVIGWQIGRPSFYVIDIKVLGRTGVFQVVEEGGGLTLLDFPQGLPSPGEGAKIGALTHTSTTFYNFGQNLWIIAENRRGIYQIVSI